MSKFNKGQTSFTSGEVSEKFQGRVDLKEYSEACDRLENFLVQRQGGAVKRPGSRFLKDLAEAQFTGGRSIPFTYSKSESYVCVFNSNTVSLTPLRVFKTDGTEATVTFDAFQTVPSTYNPKNWKYSQSGDVLVLTYSAPSSNTDTVLTTTDTGIAPAVLVRTDEEVFSLVTLSFPQSSFLRALPSRFVFSPAIHRPYLPANTDPRRRMYVDTVSIGTGRTLFFVDEGNNPQPFFKKGHSFSGSSKQRVGTFFRIQKSGTEGVCYGEDWKSDTLVTSANINIGTDVITATGHGFTTRDIVTLGETGAPGTTYPTITGHTLDATTGEYGDFHVRALTANTLAFYTSQADADADTSRIDFTDAGDRGIRITAKCMTQMDVTVEIAFEATLNSAGGASDDWKESAWSDEQGFPRACVFFESSLYMGGTKKKPDTIWKSGTANLVNFMETRLEQETAAPTGGGVTTSGFGMILFGDLKATDPAPFDISSKQANIIQWLEATNTLQAGTIGSEYTLNGGDTILSNTSVFIKKQTDYGSNNVQSISIGNSVLFVSRDGRRVRDFKFNRDNGSYLSINISALADHMVFRGFDGAASSTLKGFEFSELHHQPSRDTVWFLTTNNELIALTVSRESQVAAWSYHFTRSGDTIRSIAVAPSPNGDYDRLYMIVERDIDGTTEQFLEFIGDDFEHDVLNNTSSSDDDTAFYSDSAVKIVQGSTSTTVTLPNNVGSPASSSNLEGETVNVLAGDVVEKGLTVSSGQVTMSQAVPAGTVVVVGLPYASKLRTLDIEAGGDFGQSQGARKRIDRIALRLYRSQGGTYRNANQATSYDIEYSGNDVFTGIKRLDFQISPDMENQVVIEHDDPVPFNAVAMTYRGVSYD